MAKNGTIINGATSNIYNIPSVSLDMNNNKYYCVVTDSTGTVIESADSLLTVTQIIVAPIIITQPVDITVNTGQSAQFSVLSNNTNVYQWQELIGGVWTSLQNQNTNTLILTNLLPTI